MISEKIGSGIFDAVELPEFLKFIGPKPERMKACEVKSRRDGDKSLAKQ
jgi:hypothetical protein